MQINKYAIKHKILPFVQCINKGCIFVLYNM